MIEASSQIHDYDDEVGWCLTNYITLELVSSPLFPYSQRVLTKCLYPVRVIGQIVKSAIIAPPWGRLVYFCVGGPRGLHIQINSERKVPEIGLG